MNSAPQYVPFLYVLRGCSSCVSKLSRVLFAFTGTLLREPGHKMDGSTIANSRPKFGRCLRKGFRSCGKSVAMTPAGAKNEHGRHNVPGAQWYDVENCIHASAKARRHAFWHFTQLSV